LVKIDNLSKYYDDVKAVKSISFTAQPGEILGFLGANGAGKSTTLKVVSGYLSPTKGNVYVNDLNIQDNSLEIRKQIGYLPELNPLYTDMKVYDILKFSAQVRGITGHKFQKALDRVIHQCGLEGIIHKLVGACSKGYKQRVGLAMSIIHDPSILILDEPVTGLDPNQIVEIRELIKNLGKEKTIIMSSHILQEIQATVDRIVIINLGTIVADGTRDELMASLEGQTLLTMEIINGSHKTVESMSEKIDTLNIKNIEDVDGKYIIKMEYPADSDPREQIFDYAMKSNWKILEMSPNKANLEDVFRNLTMEGSKNA